MNPQAISGWLKTVGSGVDSIDQLICCLPREYQSSYIVGHSSISAQGGVPSSPRVIMYKVGDPSSAKLEGFALSANGGHSFLKQSQSLEMMFFNPRSQELEYYDLSFEKGKTPKLSERNPGLCLNCHGDGTSNPVAGPKPIFDRFGQWNRFVGGRNVMCGQTERDYYHKVDDVAAEAVKTLPRFKCLDHKALDKTEDDPDVVYNKQNSLVSIFDLTLARFNDLRLKKRIRSEHAFQKLKPAFFGLIVCSKDLRDWLPFDLMRTLESGETVRPELRGPNWKKGAADLFARDIAERNQIETKMRMQLGASQLDTKNPALSTPNTLLCTNHPDQRTAGTTMKSLMDMNVREDFAHQTEGGKSGDLVRRQILEGRFAGVENDHALRAIMQASGEDVASWVMSPTGEQGRSIDDDLIVQSLIGSELENDRDFRKKIDTLFNVSPKDNERVSSDPGTKFIGNFQIQPKSPQACDDFRKSVQASYGFDPRAGFPKGEPTVR